MGKSIFREKSLKRMYSADEIDLYMKVPYPGAWLLWIAIALLIAAVTVWFVMALAS